MLIHTGCLSNEKLIKHVSNRALTKYVFSCAMLCDISHGIFVAGVSVTGEAAPTPLHPQTKFNVFIAIHQLMRPTPSSVQVLCDTAQAHINSDNPGLSSNYMLAVMNEGLYY